jgi:hemerythrin
MEVFNHYKDLINLRLGEFKPYKSRFEPVIFIQELKQHFKEEKTFFSKVEFELVD